MSTRRKAASHAQVTELQKQKDRVRAAEQRADKLAAKRRNYEVPYVVHKFMPYRYELHRLEAGSIDLDDMRKEYSRLRSAANKRLQRIGQTEFSKSEIYKSNQGKFKKLRDIQDTQELRELLAEVNKFLNAKRSTLTYLKLEKESLMQNVRAENERMKYMKLKTGSSAFDDILREDELPDYWEFMNFMRMIANSLKVRLYDSEQVSELYHSLHKRSISWQDILKDNQLTPDSNVDGIWKAFAYWQDHKTDLDNYETRKKQLGIKGNHTGIEQFKAYLTEVDTRDRKKKGRR